VDKAFRLWATISIKRTSAIARICVRVSFCHIQDQYLTARGFDAVSSTTNEFVPKLLESQAFSLFVQENGPPHRKLHLFDEVSTKVHTY